MKTALFAWLLLLSIGVPAATPTTSPMLFNQSADTPQSRYAIELMTQVYQNLGIGSKLIDFNYQSVLVAANEGILDGQLARVASVATQYPNLIQIPVPLFSFHLTLVSSCKTCTLAQLPNLVVVSGYPVIESYLAEHPYPGQLVEVQNISTQLNLLHQEKISAALMLDFHVSATQYDRLQAKWSFRYLKHIDTYHFVHNKHQALVPAITAELQRLKDDGTMAQLRAKHGFPD
ncbi:hypothetical protein ACFOEE_01240 [Pseudoalteromonas fenneropenaei]|uniref:Solute-binding protein family 3/N-terminal domain-containing protein n=1 Tax=Pseudoalteromonas fenneropenaei TaxID=1737459 RepID=A0ABV7CEY0_9GAMM